MRKKKLIEVSSTKLQVNHTNRIKQFYLEFLTEAQKTAWEEYVKSDVLFLVGPAGTGKSHLAIAFALQDILEKTKSKILLSRPVVEAGESLGYLPGDVDEKVFPYMIPLYDCLDKMCGSNGEENREYINKRIELAPLAFLRGRTFDNSVCILDEAQNCTSSQLKLFLTRLGQNSKMIITGDPSQSDLSSKSSDLMNIVQKVKHLSGVGVVQFDEECIVRHPLVREIVKLI